jgi:hypothetical protein
MLEGPPPPSAALLLPPLWPGELSMLLWAYAIVMPRDRPTGWERPRRVEHPPARSSVVPPPLISSSMAPFDRMLEGRRRRIEGSVVGRDDDIDVSFVAFVQFESANDDDSVGFPSDDDNDGMAGCLGADGNSSARRTTTLMGGCTWGELSNVTWSYAARGACGPGGGAMLMMTNLVGEATRRMIAWHRGDGAAQGCDTDCVGAGHNGIGQRRRR